MSAGRTGVYEIATEDYFADNVGCDAPTLSSSIAKILTQQTPRHAHARHPKLGGVSHGATDATLEGTALHSMLLGAGRDVVLVECEMEVEKAKGRGDAKTPARVEVVKPGDYRTNAAKARREAIQAEGGIPLLAKDFDRIVKAASALRQNLRELQVDLSGEVEQVLLWVEHSDDGTPVQCKAMLDLVDFTTGRIVDLKTCESAHGDAIQRSVDGFGYDIQQAAYTSAFEHVRPPLTGRVSFEFLFLERGAPHDVSPITLNEETVAAGLAKWRRAVNAWARCLREGRWPGYGRQVVGLPPWALNRELERMAVESSGAAGADESEAA